MGDLEKRQPAELGRTLDTLAEKINAEHRAFYGSLRITFEHGVRAGELLTAAKALVAHGQWLEWLAQNFEGSTRTAQEYMRLFRNKDEIEANARSSAHSSISGALKEISSSVGTVSEIPREELQMLKAATDQVWCLSVNLDNVANCDTPTRRAYAAEQSWRALLYAVREYQQAEGFAAEYVEGEVPAALAEDVDRWRGRVQWWAAQQEWIETLVRPVDCVPFYLPELSKIDPDKHKRPLADSYDTDAMPSPRQYVRQLCGPIV